MHSCVNERSPSTKQEEDLDVTSSLRKANLICIQSRMSVYASQLLCVFVCVHITHTFEMSPPCN